MTNSVLSFESVTKRYRTGDFWRPRTGVGLDAVSFHLAPGEVFGLVGLNGAGKTTLMKTAVGLLRPDQGRVSLFGLDPRDRRARARFGYLPELPYFPGYLSSREVLTYYTRLHGFSSLDAPARVTRVLETVGLTQAADEPIRNYSKGMQQRVGLAQTLLHDPELIFLDEPMSGLDPQGIKEMRDVILAQKRAGKTVFFNSHTLAEVERICDRVGVMFKGQMVLVEPVADLVRKYQSKVVLGVPAGDAAKLAEAKALGLDVKSEGSMWTFEAANNALDDSSAQLRALGLGHPSVLSVGSPLETAFLAIIKEVSHA